MSCGIPDFRSRDGIYSRLAVEYPDLPDPAAMFDIQYFKKNPRPFFKFAKVLQGNRCWTLNLNSVPFNCARQFRGKSLFC